MPYCIAQYCKNSDQNNLRKVHFHTLPNKKKKSSLHRQWLAKCCRPPGKDKQARVCSDHFVDEDYSNLGQYRSGYASNLLLKPDAVPSVFGTPETPTALAIPTPSPASSASKRRARGQARNNRKLLQDLMATVEESTTMATTTTSTAPVMPLPAAEVASSTSEDTPEDGQLGDESSNLSDMNLHLPPLPPIMKEGHCQCCGNSPCCRQRVSVNDASTQTDMDVIIEAIAKDHSYSKSPLACGPAEEDKTSNTSTTVTQASDYNEITMDIVDEVLEEVELEESTLEDSDSDNVPNSESEFDTDIDMTDDVVGDETENVVSEPIPENVAEHRKFLVFEHCLMGLFKKCQKTGCTAEVTELKKTISGSRLIVKTKCARGCNYIWSSQPTLDKMGAGNLLLSAAVLFSGNTYARLKDMADLLKMPILGESQFYAIQKSYLFPVVNETWISEQIAVLDGLSNEEDIIMCGDGRCDSPGHCAKYGTYSLMEVKYGFIVEFCVHCTADPNVKNSNAMEPMGMRRCLDQLEKWNIKIKVLTTDRHISIRKILREEYPNIVHQFDLWHLVKSITKNIVQICGKKKELSPLLDWLNSISNHFWWCAESCGGNVDVMREKWESVVYHVVNIHTWQDKQHFHGCEHPPLNDEDGDKSWLRVGSPAHDALVKVVKDKALRKDLPHCTLYCHTGNLEVYHSLLLKYAPKRQHFSYEGMVCRTQLAAIDHNNHVGRPQATTKDGKLQFDIVCPKSQQSTNRKWVAKARKEKKTHPYWEDMMKDVVRMRCHNLGISHADLPSIMRNAAGIDKPDPAEVIARTKQLTRFAPR